MRSKVTNHVSLGREISWTSQMTSSTSHCDLWTSHRLCSSCATTPSSTSTKCTFFKVPPPLTLPNLPTNDHKRRRAFPVEFPHEIIHSHSLSTNQFPLRIVPSHTSQFTTQYCMFAMIHNLSLTFQGLNRVTKLSGRRLRRCTCQRCLVVDGGRCSAPRFGGGRGRWYTRRRQ